MSLKKVTQFQFEVNSFLKSFLDLDDTEPNPPSTRLPYTHKRVYLTNNKTHFTQPTSPFRLTYYEKYSNVMFLNGEKQKKSKVCMVYNTMLVLVYTIRV